MASEKYYSAFKEVDLHDEQGFNEQQFEEEDNDADNQKTVGTSFLQRNSKAVSYTTYFERCFNTCYYA